jgi:glutamine cyclotransferase
MPLVNDLDVTLGNYAWDTSVVAPGIYYINGSVWDSSSQSAFNNCNNSFEITAPDLAPSFAFNNCNNSFEITAPDLAPSFFVTNPGSSPGEIYSQGTIVSVSWAAMDDNPWPAGGLVVNLSFGATPAGGTPLANDQDVVVSYLWDTAAVAPGVYYINGSVYDSAGQTTFHASNNSFTIIPPDNQPTLFVTNPGSTPGEQYVQGTIVPISWAAADDNPWPATGLIVNITYGPTTAGGTPIAINQDVVTIYPWDTAAVAPGFYYVNASVWDSRGQTVFANCNNTFEITAPDTQPTLFITNPGSTPGEIYGQGSLVTISWAAADESPWPMAGMIVNLSYGLTPAGGTPIANDQDVAVSYSWDTTLVPVGFYYINASVYDSSGNVTFASSNNSFEITAPDTTPPVIMNTQAVPDPQELGLPTNISATITDDTTIDPATAFVNVTYPSAMTTNISMSRNVDTFWADRPFGEIGIYSFAIWVSDTSGNWANDAGTFEVVDTTPPSVSGTTAIPSPQMSGGFVNVSTSILPSFPCSTSRWSLTV